MTREELFNKGYTYSAAARKCGCSIVHVYLVVNGKRQSAVLLAKLRALPKRNICLRERIAH